MNLKLSDAAEDALRELALRERRDARQQAEFMLESELARRGLLTDEPRDASEQLVLA